MAGNDGKITSYTTCGRTYRVGMTAEEAKNQDIYKKIFGKDFCDIDQPKKTKDGRTLPPDGVLDEQEILTVVRDDAHKRYIGHTVTAVTAGATAGIGAFTGIGTLWTFAGSMVAAENAFEAADWYETYKNADEQLNKLDVKY